MKRFCIICFLLWVGLSVFSQKSVQLKNGTVRAEENLTPDFISKFNVAVEKNGGKTWILLQFKNTPSPAERKSLAIHGIEILQFIPPDIYTVCVTHPITPSILKQAGVKSIIELKPELKIDQSLLRDQPAELEVMILFFKSFDPDTALSRLQQHGALITGTDFKAYNILQMKVPAGKLFSIAALPFIEYIEPIPPAPVELNFDSRNSTKANLLSSSLPGEYNLTGEGVTVGIGEVGFLQAHVDFKDRLTRNSMTSTSNNYHSTHVHGVVGGAGLINEMYRGYAPKAQLLPLAASQTLSVVSQSADQHFGMAVSNNSYVSGLACSKLVYTLQEFIADKQSVDHKYIQHVFAGGNSGQVTCAGYPAGFNTILSQYHSAKSILSVGSTLNGGELATYSSRGPAGGGRIKPEIVAAGTNIISTVPTDSYGQNSGSSIAAPAVAGGLALLYQRYRQLHNGNNPRNSLIKAIICNTATDLGNKGPDYSYGFGYMNLLRAVKAIDNTNYTIDSITHQSSRTHTISIPPGITQLKVMLYWPDPPASLFSTRALVNDLDLQVGLPNSLSVLPYILDTLPANVANAATRGEDHINNIEQVVIDNPVPGDYTIKVTGKSIGQHPLQEYVIVYDKVQDEVVLTFPNGGEGLATAETITIQWDAWGQSQSGFHLQYSADNGINWQTIDAAVAPALRQYNWQLPAISTNKAMVRVTRNADGKMSTSTSFVILGVPTLALSQVQCPEYISIEWNQVPGATDYAIMMVRKGEMIVIDSTTASNYVFRNLSPETIYWVSVRPRINQKPGRRSLAVSRMPATGSCAGNISDNDLKPERLITPLYGRKFTSQSLSNAETISIRIRNFDDEPVSGFSVQYAVNNGPWVTENATLTIPAAGFADYSFTTPYNFSSLGDYNIKLAIKKTGDTNSDNDTLIGLVRHLDNPVLFLSIPVTEGFNQAESRIYSASFGGLHGASRFDFINNAGPGYLTIAAPGLSDNSNKALILSSQSSGDQDLVATFNLSNYDTAVNNISFSFTYSKLSSDNALNDKLWLRGSDTSPWIEVMNLDPGTNIFFTDNFISIQTGKLLRAANQNFSSSFQLKWGRQGIGNSYAIDNVSMHDASNDMELVSIDSFNLKSCNLGGNVPLRITVRNHSKFTLNNIPVHYKIDGGPVQDGVIPSLASNASMSFTFAATANLSGSGNHIIEAWTGLAGDSYTLNDRKTLSIRNQPSITNFPYLENFENGSGNWYAEGVNSSWEYGTPASRKIKGAASGLKAWKTSLAGTYNNLENSFLYSPCFDIGYLDRPMISISIALNIDSCNFCDNAGVQFSTNGRDWKNVMNFQQSGYNWPSAFKSPSYDRWHVATASLSDTMGLVQFRINMRSDFSIAYDGIAIDDIHIYDSTTSIFDGGLNTGVIQQNINGVNGWIDFKENGKIIASVQPNGQSPGITKVQGFLQNVNPDFHGQYYLRRSFAMQAANPLSDSVGVRLYFLDTETDSLLFARNCSSCLRPPHAYRFGLSQYTTPETAEINGILSDNIKGTWKFINSSSVKTVPYQKGYYIEFKTKDFSELWLNNGGYNNNSYLPAEVVNFSAKQAAVNNAVIEWTISSDINLHRFEIEVAKGNNAFRQENYVRVGEVVSTGPSASPRNYNFMDATPGKEGVYYYRLKIIDVSGNYSFSRSQPVVFNNELVWKIAPNLSTGMFTLIYQVSSGEQISLEVFNSNGSLVKKAQFSGTGFIGEYVIDLQHPGYAAGLYMIRIKSKDQDNVFKIVKQ